MVVNPTQTARAGPFADHQVDRESFHRRIKHFLYRFVDAVYFINE